MVAASAVPAAWVLAVEFYDRQARPDTESLKCMLAWTHLEEVRVLRRVPVDKRHNAKIDYPSLHRLLG